jgi:acetoin:2,6-dichlorophenolindophenol oxidoreductase subunit beta
MPKNISNIADLIRETLIKLLRKDKNIFLIGEGVNDPKGIFGTTKGLNKIFKNRVIESPISENAVTGVAIGAAKMGMRPIVIHQRVDFIFYALEQIINSMSKTYYITNGKFNVPIVIRLIVGKGWGQGPMHSQVLDTLFAKIPGLKVYIPTFAEDFKFMLEAAVKDNNPVIFFEHRWLHNLKLKKKSNSKKVRGIIGAKKITDGKDVTVVVSGINTIEVLKAYDLLLKQKVKIEIINLNCLQPLKIDTIIKSVKKTRRLIIIENGHIKFGFGSEIISQIVEKYPKIFRSNPIRIGNPFYPTPMSKNYISEYYPSKKKIFYSILKILNKKIKINEIKNLKKFLDEEYIDIPDKNFQGPF